MTTSMHTTLLEAWSSLDHTIKPTEIRLRESELSLVDSKVASSKVRTKVTRETPRIPAHVRPWSHAHGHVLEWAICNASSTSATRNGKGVVGRCCNEWAVASETVSRIKYRRLDEFA